MGRHRLNYMGPRRGGRQPVGVIAAAVTICTAMLLVLALVVAGLLSRIASDWANVGSATWVALLTGLVAICVWRGVVVVRDTCQVLRDPDDDADVPEWPPDDGNDTAL